ncbi:kinase-like domain-containing protein [Hypoxylon sp. NC0597]|nr:kinase-like domain-containing protein [Hypoxylon sp. NC0597]
MAAPGGQRPGHGYKEMAQAINHLFKYYRTTGRFLPWNPESIAAAYPIYSKEPIPKVGGSAQPTLSVGAWDDRRKYKDTEVGLKLDGPPIQTDDEARYAQRRHQQFSEWFSNTGGFQLQKALGWGGSGIVAHFRYQGADPPGPPRQRDIAVKFPLGGWRKESIHKEIQHTKKVKQSAHCIQMIDPKETGKRAREILVPLSDDDSSTDGGSSGNESGTEHALKERRQRKRKRRLNRRRSEWSRKMAMTRHTYRQRQISLNNQAYTEDVNKPQRDFIIFEYMENGDLAGLIHRLAEDPEGGRVPNRVLWAFWLCLVRACVGMEYPPRKFHPNRKDPTLPPDAEVLHVERQKNSIIRWIRRQRGTVTYDPSTQENLQRIWDLQGNDLIETIPKDWKARRKQNFVHFDIDPQNILMDGLEMDVDNMAEWQDVRKAARQRIIDNEGADEPFKDIKRVDQRTDRLKGEHELVPKLKLADFGLAQVVKQDKRNIYYSNKRPRGKNSYFAPEQFSHNWDFIPGIPDGDDLANSDVAGYYGPHTNIWGIALTMWVLITKYHPPMPPQPQAPEEVVEAAAEYLSANPTTEETSDAYTKVLNNLKFPPISYCALLWDSSIHDYDYIDKDLRRTIYECLYHRPNDRPTLSVLLEQATQKASATFDNETDQDIREWVHRWLYEPAPAPAPPPPPPPSPASSPPAAPPAPPEPPTQPPVPPAEPSGRPAAPAAPPTAPPAETLEKTAPPAKKAPRPTTKLIRKNAKGPAKGTTEATTTRPSTTKLTRRKPDPPLVPAPTRPVTAIARATFITTFPLGYTIVKNTVNLGDCGLTALSHSLATQLPPHRAVNPPTFADLLAIFAEMRDRGDFDLGGWVDPERLEHETDDRPWRVDTLAAVLAEWARRNGLQLRLGIIQGRPGAGHPTIWLVSTAFANPLTIWICNARGNHWEGTRAVW